MCVWCVVTMYGVMVVYGVVVVVVVVCVSDMQRFLLG